MHLASLNEQPLQGSACPLFEDCICICHHFLPLLNYPGPPLCASLRLVASKYDPRGDFFQHSRCQLPISSIEFANHFVVRVFEQSSCETMHAESAKAPGIGLRGGSDLHLIAFTRDNTCEWFHLIVLHGTD
jgi:hypothetical protein